VLLSSCHAGEQAAGRCGLVMMTVLAPDEVNRRLGRGISFGNALDAAAGGPEFGLRERYFDEVRKAGFSTVRLPVRWSAHAGQAPPQAISRALFGRVDWAVSQALRRDLNVVLNVHHYHELNDAPHEHRARFLALWTQIAAHYARWSRRLHFELLNEPHGAMTPQVWNDLLPTALAAVRRRDADRLVIIGPARMNDSGALPELTLPADDLLAVTIHYYAPFEFTHQARRGLPEPIIGWARPGVMIRAAARSMRTWPARQRGRMSAATRCSSANSARTRGRI
jgi:endoglucanase